jgi:hypothetical protein
MVFVLKFNELKKILDHKQFFPLNNALKYVWNVKVSHTLEPENFQNYNQKEILNPSSVPKLMQAVKSLVAVQILGR